MVEEDGPSYFLYQAYEDIPKLQNRREGGGKMALNSTGCD
jgi:hypothetical protein